MKTLSLCTAIVFSVLFFSHTAVAQFEVEDSAMLEIGIDQINELINQVANGKPIIIKNRTFHGKNFTSEAYNEFSNVQYDRAIFSPLKKSIIAYGNSEGLDIVKEYRFLEYQHKMYVICDIYFNVSEEDLFEGRSIPILLTSSSISKEVSPPVITSISGETYKDGSGVEFIKSGKCNTPCGSLFNNCRVVNYNLKINGVDEQKKCLWYIYGSNMGKSGTVTLGWQTFRMSRWSPTYIYGYPSTSSYSDLGSCTFLVIKTSDGRTASYGVDIIAAIRTRPYGQCTWYAAYKRCSLGKFPSRSAFPKINAITASYIPQVGDQIYFYIPNTGNHVVILESVTNPPPLPISFPLPGVPMPPIVYRLNIGQYNAICDNIYNSYSVDFSVQNGSIIKNITSSIPGGKLLGFSRGGNES